MKGFKFYLLCPLLCVASVIYAFVVLTVKFFYKAGVLRTYRPSLKVVSVGNITMGGTGKTPFVVFLAKKLIEQKGQRVAVLLRGYKRPQRNKGVGVADFYQLGDEAAMLLSDCPGIEVLVGRDRIANVRRFQDAKSVDTVILDDGFQHWRLKRDLDIVLIDARDPFGNNCILPLGVMRETLRSLERADIFCLTHCDEAAPQAVAALETRLLGIQPKAAVLQAAHVCEGLYSLKTGNKVPLDILKGESVGLLSGIAHNDSFLYSIVKIGASPSLKFFFSDHHEYSSKEIRDAAACCKGAGIKKIVTTQKDAQRMAAFVKREDLDCGFFVLKIVLRITKGEEALDGRLRSLYSA